ncbi:class I SAM-dependent methyltransferase [Streptomyces sp. NBC_00588]|uniref:class I SAM-dependent methyltransferase n=1 Tax=Streptomyces sp. NBC_00588 TaxID=2975784 RepID=UPI002E8033E7|nr:class I SAM-dependent methyltransferase [Streptomyces sp. NBC_00588]WUB37470.1 class I SAM-dependent methyltransferase [Streptomyces sp. NBC_00588]
MTDGTGEVAAEHTAVRVALWRALHLRADPPPYVIEDEVGLRLAGVGAGPGEDWRERPDMDVVGTRRMRASIVARARYVEDLVVERAGEGLDQYVVLGAGLDTFAQRRPDVGAGGLRVFEVDQAGPQEWKRQRLEELGFGVPEWLRLVPVDFEGDWWGQLLAGGLDPGRPAVVASAGVTMYLTAEAIRTTFRLVASLAPGSTLVSTFLRPVEDVEPEEQPRLRTAMKGAEAAGTPFRTFYRPPEILALAHETGFRKVRHVSAADLEKRYFAGRRDGLRPSRGEELLVADV